MSSRRRTETSNFGVGGRESHDSTKFYERFRAPVTSDDDTVLPPEPVANPFMCGDSRHMNAVADGSVALVVTSPPYFAGKQYEEELEREGVPSSYLEYLELLTDVFAECARKLEPGGRIAVNVANLGRKPYRSLSADVVRILEHDLGLLLRGELVWQKGEGASNSCAWGSFRSPTNPVLRDVTERVVVASKGRFDRALSASQRAKRGLPHVSTLNADDFMALTLDVWPMQPESAKRVGHPAPFPVELPEQLIGLYTFENDLVLDPFMGSGTTLLAAARLGRRYVGYDMDPSYVDLARTRVAEGLATLGERPPAHLDAADDGKPAGQVAEAALLEAGFTISKAGYRVPKSGVMVSFLAVAPNGRQCVVDVAGAFTSTRGGLSRAETVWRTIGRATAVRARLPDLPFVVLTTELPRAGGDAEHTLRAAVPGTIAAVINLLDPADRNRLAAVVA